MKKVICERKRGGEECFDAREQGMCPAGIEGVDIFPDLHCPKKKDNYYFVPTSELQSIGLS